MRKLALIIALCLIPVIASARGIQNWHKTMMGLYGAAGGVSDGEMGHTTGGSTESWSSGYAYHTDFTPTTAGQVSYVFIYATNMNGDTICVSIHNTSGTTLAYGEVSVNSDNADWYMGTLASPYTLVDATTYYVAQQVDGGGGDIGYDNSAGNEIKYYNMGSYDCDGNLDADPSNDSNSDSSAFLQVWFNNTGVSP